MEDVKDKTLSFGQRVAYVGIAIGTETRWPDILTLYFSGFAAGASLVAALRRRPGSKAGGSQAATRP